MPVRAALVARLAVYGAALLVVATAPVVPARSTAAAALAVRAAPPDPSVPIRIGLGTIIVAGIVLEFLRRRPVWR